MEPSQGHWMSRTDVSLPERQVLKLGGLFAVVGGLGYFMTLLVHGDLPDQTTEIMLSHIAGRPEWPILKLSLIASIILWVGAFVALGSSLSHGASWLLARLATGVLLIGAAVVVVEYSILGHGMKRIADAWQVASGAERERHLLIAEALAGIASGLFLSFIAWLLGLPFLLMGLAVAFERSYPKWMGWLPVICGTGALLGGTLRFLGIDLVPFPLMYGGFIIPMNLWLAGMGILMWRRGQSVAGWSVTSDRLDAACG